MNYRNCRHCPESEIIYTLGKPGITIVCKLTGDRLEVNKCPLSDEVGCPDRTGRGRLK